nr:MAG: DNA polymerase [Grey warbler atadenovirus]
MKTTSNFQTALVTWAKKLALTNQTVKTLEMLSLKIKDILTHIATHKSAPTPNNHILNIMPFSTVHVHKHHSEKTASYVTSVALHDHSHRDLHIIIDTSGKVLLCSNSYEAKKCYSCGTVYMNFHRCSVRKSNYFAKMVEENNMRYKLIKFFPITSPKAHTLKIIYDIETFTKHTKIGKQLLPFMLAFAIDGDSHLIEIAHQEALRLGATLDNETGVFYTVSKNPKHVTELFRKLRLNIHTAIAELFLKEITNLYNIPPVRNYKELCKVMKQSRAKHPPIFYNVFIIGHNISAFDEIIMWAHMTCLDTIKSKFPQLNWRRLFLPRAGKILFDDVSATVPNPSYEPFTQETSNRWRVGLENPNTDMKWQGVAVMVRDTYLLTHTSLRNAAKAYGLPIEKGDCPYEAVNEAIRIGTYEKEENGFPVRKYWQSDEEYAENRERHLHKQYDIMEQTIKYCIRDVQVTKMLVAKLSSAYSNFYIDHIVQPAHTRFDVFKRPTVSSNTHALFKQVLYMEEGKSEHMPGIVAPTCEGYTLVRRSIKGGRCYPTFLGIFTQNTYVYDVCGMYASALTHPMPYGIPITTNQATNAIRHLQSLLDSDKTISYFDTTIKPCIVKADCFPPPLEKLDILPPFCVKTDDGSLLWTNEPIIDEVVTSIDLITMHNRGWKCEIKIDDEYVVWPEMKCICSKYVKININAKEKATREGNETLRSLSKLLSNALYGSFATKLENKKTILGEIDDEDIEDGWEIDNVTYLNCKSLESDEFEMNLFEHARPKDGEQITTERQEQNLCRKTIKFVDINSDDLVAYTIKNHKPVENDRYATQIASFVLAWTRAFVSEWSTFLFSEDMGTAIENRELKSVYGDTDSLFLTEKGRQLFIKNGSHRIKGDINARLVYDEKNPSLAWAAECETVCTKCGSDAYSKKSVYIAPKMYALGEMRCTNCDAAGNDCAKGKVKAKGHNKADVTFESLARCYIWTNTKSQQYRPEKDKFTTSRTTIKKNILQGNSKNTPMTIKETILIRTLEPWKTPRLRMEENVKKNQIYGNGHLMYPFDESHPYNSKQQVVENILSYS